MGKLRQSCWPPFEAEVKTVHQFFGQPVCASAQHYRSDYQDIIVDGGWIVPLYLSSPDLKLASYS